MAAPTTDALKYYSRDTKSQDNEQYIEAVHGPLGYYIVEKLRSHIYGSPGGYFCDFGEINKRLFCKNNCNISIEDLNAVLETCFNEEVALYSKEMYDKYKILTSSGIQKRWKRIVTDAGRKNVVIKDTFLLIEQETIVNSPIIGELKGDNNTINGYINTHRVELTVPLSGNNGGIIGGLIPQTKVNNNKVDNSKEKEKKNDTVAKASVPNPDKDLIWQTLVDTWFDFNQAKFKEKPTFSDTDGKKLKSIAKKLCARAVEMKKIEWTQATARSQLLNFLEAAYVYDNWLPKNFLLKNLESQFDAVAMNQKAKVQVASAAPKLSVEELKAKFKNNTIKITEIQLEHFEETKLLGCELTENHFNIAQTKRVESLVCSNQQCDKDLAEHYLKKVETVLTKKDRSNLELLAKRYAVRDWLYSKCTQLNNS